MIKLYSGKSPQDIGLKALSSKIKTLIADSGSAFTSAPLTENVIGFESLDPTVKGVTTNTLDNISVRLNDIINECMSTTGFESFLPSNTGDLDAQTRKERERMRENSMTAAAITVAALGNPSKYHNKALSSVASLESNDVGLRGAHGDLGYTPQISQAAFESFDQKSLNDYMPFSVMFNLFALRQSEDAELLFPTVVLTPDQTGIVIEVARYLVWDLAYHQTTGAAYAANKFNLLDAVVDPSVLRDDSLKIIPVFQPDNSTADKFISNSLVAVKNVKVSNVDVPTAPLKPGVIVDLLGLSTYAPLIGANLMNNTDQLDTRISLDQIYLDASTPSTQTIAVGFSVANMPFIGFRAAQEGNFRNAVLNFHTDDLVISSSSLGIDGTAVSLFSDIVAGDYIARLSVNVTGNVNLETSNCMVNQTSIIVSSITDNQGNDISLKTGIGATIVSKLETMKFVGYDLLANRTNSNRRNRGKMLDLTYEKEQRSVYLNSPLSIPGPLTQENGAMSTQVLIDAARIRNTNNAYTKLFNYLDALKSQLTVAPRKGHMPSIEGLGREFLQPFYEEHELNVLTSLNSISTGDRAQDVQAVFVNSLRDIVFRMYKDSRFQAALDQVTNGSGEKPLVKIVTDQTIIRHLMVTGDTRTLSTIFDNFIIKSSQDERMTNKIIITMTMNNAMGPHPLSGGNFLYVPELISSVPVTRDGAIFMETMVQPRTTHIVNTPVFAVINVSNLSAALVDKTATPALADQVNSGWTDSIKSQPTGSNDQLAYPPGNV